jgi:large subunit ribosomal protein L29
MKASELRQKTIAELKAEHVSLLREQFNLRMQKSTGQLAKNHEIGRVKHDIARVLTVINEKSGVEE